MVHERCHAKLNSHTNYSYHPLVRKWLCWTDQVVVTQLHMSALVITCAIQVPSTGEKFICSAIYAFNIAVDRIRLWEELRGTKEAYDHLNLPWILIGDFNETLASSEHSRALDYRRDQSGMRHFQEAMTDCSVMDLPFTGALFTWWNNRVDDPIGISDRARCLIRTTGITNDARKPYRFFNYLAEHKDFFPTVKRVWDTTETIFPSRTALSRFHRKLKLLKQPLWELNKTHYGDLPARTKQAYDELCECQNIVLLDPTPENVARAAEVAERWNVLARIEEKFYRQKSCVQWLTAGDQNVKFFTIWFRRG